MRVRPTALVVLFPVLSGACSSAPPPPPPPPVASASAPPAPPPLPPARWVDARGASHHGVRLAGKGMLALVAGKRVLVADDGATTHAKGPASEALDRLELVPAGGGHKVVGIQGTQLFRYDDPLGEGKRIATLSAPISTVSTWPGRLLLKVGSATVWLDLEGAAVDAPPLALVPTQAHFVDEKHGLATFPAAGMAVTSDGGATWRLLDVRPTADFDAREGFLRLGERSVDAAKGALGLLTRPKEPLLVRWLRTETSPLEAAARVGVAAGDGKALVAFGTDLVEVDLATGALGAMHSLRSALGNDDVEPGLWKTTAFPAKEGSSQLLLYTATGSGPLRPVLDVTLTGKSISPHKRLEFGGLFGMTAASSTRGFLLPGPCSTAGGGFAEGPDGALGSCVRQPNGTFTTIWSDAQEEGRGPLADGGMVGLVPAPTDASPAALDLVTVDKAGKKIVVAKLCETNSSACSPVAPLDEVAPGEYAALFDVMVGGADEARVEAVFVSNGVAKSQSLPSLGLGMPTYGFSSYGRAYAQGRAVVETPEGLRVSLDAGRSWKDVPAPRQSGNLEELAVGELGLVWGKMVRLGWGETTGPVPAVDRDPAPPASVVLPGEKKQARLLCEAGKDNKSLTLFTRDGAAEAALAPAKGKGYSVQSSTLLASRTHAHLELQTPEAGAKPAKKPTLVLSWVDQAEVGAKVRTASGPAPEDTGKPGKTSLVFAASAGDKVFVVIKTGWVLHAGRVQGGKLELVKLGESKWPRDAAIAADGAVAWVGDEGVGYWPSKGAPRVLAKVRPGQLAVGAPTKDAIPLVVGEKGWAAFRLLPIPKEGAAPPWLDASGWKAAPFAPGSLGALAVCGAKAPAHRFVLSGTKLDVKLPAGPVTLSTSLAIRADGATACLEGAVARMGNEWFVRADLSKKKAEGGTATKPVQAMTCKLE